MWGWQVICPVYQIILCGGLEMCLSWVKSFSWAFKLWKNGECVRNINIYKWIHAYVRLLCLGKWERDYTFHTEGDTEKKIKWKGRGERSPTEKTDCPVPHLFPEILWFVTATELQYNQKATRINSVLLVLEASTSNTHQPDLVSKSVTHATNDFINLVKSK